LNDIKGSTIRPAWKKICSAKGDHGGVDIIKDGIIRQHKKCHFIDVEKQPRFQVGDEIRLEWKSRTSPKGSWFCKLCGSLVKEKTLINGFGTCERCYPKKSDATIDGIKVMGIPEMIVPVFPKILGTKIITGVSKVKMWIGNDVPLMAGFTYKESETRAIVDGFKDLDSFVKYFMSNYDLNQPKPFYIYDWVKNVPRKQL
jgi:hypothetical protein